MTLISINVDLDGLVNADSVFSLYDDYQLGLSAIPASMSFGAMTTWYQFFLGTVCSAFNTGVPVAGLFQRRRTLTVQWQWRTPTTSVTTWPTSCSGAASNGQAPAKRRAKRNKIKLTEVF